MHTWGLLSSVHNRWGMMSVRSDWLLGEWWAAVAWVIACQAPLAVFGRCMACENWKTGNNICWETQKDRCEDWWLNDLDRYQTRTGRFDVWYCWLTDCTSLTQARLLLSAKSGLLHSSCWQEQLNLTKWCLTYTVCKGINESSHFEFDILGLGCEMKSSILKCFIITEQQQEEL